MAIVAMKKVQVVILKSFKKPVFNFLQQQDAFECIGNVNAGDDIKDLRLIEKDIADLSFAIKYLEPHVKIKRQWSLALMGNKEIFSAKKVEEIAHQFDFKGLVAQVQDIEARNNTLHAQLIDIDKDLNDLKEFKSFDFDVQGVQNWRTLSLAFFRVKSKDLASLEQSINDSTRDQEIGIISQTETETYFYVIYTKKVAKFIQDLTKQFGAVEINFSNKCHNPAVYIKDLQQKRKDSIKEQGQLKSKAEQLAKDLPKLKACYDYATWNLDQEQNALKGEQTNDTVTYKGWIRDDKLQHIKIGLQQITENSVVLEEMPLHEEEMPPVAIKNNKFFTPFETVTKIYGLPQYNEVDPSPYLSIFFLIFFGFCLTDAIYGLILTSICLFVLKFMKLPKDMKNMINLVGMGSFVTIFMGIIFFGYGGMTKDVVPAFLWNLGKFDMATQVNEVMMIAFGLGLIHLWFGTLIAGVHEFRTGSKAKALITNFSWTVFFAIIGGTFLMTDKFLAKNMIYGAVIAMMFCLTYEVKWSMKIVMGPLNFLNEAIGWFSSVLSYARLFALGLSTGVLAIVFNQIALTMKEMLPFGVNYIVMFVIIVLGHILNIAINTMGAFIHSARLQFVEFFGKFMAGGGTAFRPLSRKSTYVYLEE